MREVSKGDLDASYGLYPARSVLELGEAASGEAASGQLEDGSRQDLTSLPLSAASELNQLTFL